MRKNKALELLRKHPNGISNTHAVQEHGYWTLSQRVGDLRRRGFLIHSHRGPFQVMFYKLLGEPEKEKVA